MPDSKGFSRRQFLSGVASTATTSCLPLSGVAILKCNSTPALAAQNTSVRVSREAVSAAPVIIVNSGYRLLIDSVRGTIASFQSTYGVNRELLIRDHVRLPLFNVEFMNDGGEFKLITSSDAKKITVNKEENEKGQTITIEFKQIGDLPVDGLVTIRCPTNETLTYWNLELKNGTKSWIGHVQFPVIEVPFDSPMEGDPSHILSSSLDGSLAGPVEPAVYQRPGWTRHTPLERQWGGTESITPDLWLEDIWRGRQRNVPEIWRYPNYPGQWASTQLMAYYNSAGGLYVACDDATGLPKFIDRVMEDDGVTLGLAHYPGTRGPGETKLPYNVVHWYFPWRLVFGGRNLSGLGLEAAVLRQQAC